MRLALSNSLQSDVLLQSSVYNTHEERVNTAIMLDLSISSDGSNNGFNNNYLMK
jgi:hypothetical protein